MSLKKQLLNLMSKTTVFIVGATSFVGKHLVKELKKSSNYSIKVIARSLEGLSNIPGFEAGVDFIEGDLLEPKSLNGLFEPSSIVINLMYSRAANEKVNLLLITNLINVCKSSKISRLIHLSSADVVGRDNSDVIYEETPCKPNTDYAVGKLKIEKKVLAVNNNEFDTVVLRPTAIIGAGGKNLIKLANDITSESRFKNYLKSCLFGNRRMNLVAIENVVSAAIYLMRYSKSFNGSVFNISDDDSPLNNYVDIESILARKFRVTECFLPRMKTPVFVLSFFLWCLGRDNVNPNRTYSTKKITELGFKKTVDFETAVSKFTEWYSSVYIKNKS
jgi:nucleoside-diphosphate-sugar epimerase